MKKTLTVFGSLMLFALCSFAQQRPVPLTIGVREVIRSVHLGEDRIVNIYLPTGYDEKDTTRYSVIYLLDGGMDEDFIHTVGLVQFNTFPWIHRIPKSIVVGIANRDRERDMSFPTQSKKDKKRFPTTGGSARFIAFVDKELRPYIQQHYAVNDQETLIGESLAGLLATEILLTKPAMFDQYIIISPSLWWDNGSLLRRKMNITASQPANNIAVYIGVGKEGVAPSEEPHVMEVDANLLADKLKAVKNQNLQVYFDYLPAEDHATVGHQAMFNALKLLYSGR